jgi:hypothetical protein
MSEPSRPPASADEFSALPSVGARFLSFVAIVVAGACGGLIGRALVDVQCHGSCATPRGIGTLLGAVSAAGGVAVMAVLVLRAMGEWRSQAPRRAQGQGQGQGEPEL